MIDPELLELLVCPETKQAVRPADAALLARVNEAVASGDLRNRAGQVIADPLAAGLIREDGRVLYPVRDDIPVMLLDEAIEMTVLSDPGEADPRTS